MPQIVLRPSPIELGLFPEQYDALVADLKAEGYEVELVDEFIERRSFPIDPETLYNLVVQVRESPEYPLVVGALIVMIQKRLRGKIGKRPRTGKLYLADGQEHRFELPEDG
jgi:hypothetical protein